MATHDHIATGLAKIGLFLRSHSWQQVEATGLTPTQAQILVHLVGCGPARVSVLADEIGVTQPTASDAVAALIRKGHVEKRPDPQGGRAAMLHAGKTAGDALARMEVWPDALLEAVDILDPAERAVFLKGLMKMIRTLQWNISAQAPFVLRKTEKRLRVAHMKRRFLCMPPKQRLAVVSGKRILPRSVPSGARQ